MRTMIEECRQRTAEAIAVMTASSLTLQTRFRGEGDNGWTGTSPTQVVWNWSLYDYRVVPKPDHRVKVMQAFLDGEAIEIKSAGWERCITPQWNWGGDDYRVAKMPDKTFEESVRAHLKDKIKDQGPCRTCGRTRRELTDLYRKLFNEEP